MIMRVADDIFKSSHTNKLNYSRPRTKDAKICKWYICIYIYIYKSLLPNI